MMTELPDDNEPVALSERALAILAFESRSWRHPSAKEQAIREEFAVSPARYYQLLGDVIDSPAALAFDPILVTRLIRLRHERRASRTPVSSR